MLLVQETQDTVTVIMRKSGATLDGMLDETGAFTQKQRGALVGHSQSWVAQRLLE